MKPEFRVVAIDCSENYQYLPGLLKRCGGKIWETYLYDASKAHYICDAIDRYELHQVDAFPDTTSVYLAEEIDEELREANNYGDVIYMNCSYIDSIPFPSNMHKPVPFTPDEEESYEEQFEEVYEYVRGNSII